ncbi:MAG: Endonuclease [Parcubacteria group bacterium GW2011_GWA1_38_7]|nr:MAG: Endonuclease [Parcubacteria group bacterium GW2011_GWA1_38_7]
MVASRGFTEGQIFNTRSDYKILMIYLVYILECADKTFYVGCTNNLERRLLQHNNSKSGAHYTKIRRPVKLLYSETHPNRSSALKREAEIKGWGREKKLDLISKTSKDQILSLI